MENGQPANPTKGFQKHVSRLWDDGTRADRRGDLLQSPAYFAIGRQVVRLEPEAENSGGLAFGANVFRLFAGEKQTGGFHGDPCPQPSFSHGTSEGRSDATPIFLLD